MWKERNAAMLVPMVGLTRRVVLGKRASTGFMNSGGRHLDRRSMLARPRCQKSSLHASEAWASFSTAVVPRYRDLPLDSGRFFSSPKFLLGTIPLILDRTIRLLAVLCRIKHSVLSNCA